MLSPKTLILSIILLFSSSLYSSELTPLSVSIGEGASYQTWITNGDLPITLFLKHNGNIINSVELTSQTNDVLFILGGLRGTNSGNYSILSSNIWGTREDKCGILVIREQGVLANRRHFLRMLSH